MKNNAFMMSGKGQFHTNEPDPKNPNKELKPYLAIVWGDILAMVDNPQQCDKAKAQWLIPSTLPSRNFGRQEREGEFWTLWADFDDDKDNPSYRPPALHDLAKQVETIIGYTGEIHTQTGVIGRGDETIIGTTDYELYNSRSATVDMQKSRLLVPLNDPLSGADWMLAQEVLNDKLEALGIKPDRATERAGQLCYLPNRGEFYESRSKRVDGWFRPLQSWQAEIRIKRDQLAAQHKETETAKAAAKARREALKPGDGGNSFERFKNTFNNAYIPQEWMTSDGYDQRGNTFRHPNSQSGSFSASVKRDEYGVLRVNALSPNDPLYTAGQGAHDAFSTFCTLVHGGDINAALKDAGDNLLAIGSVSFNKAVQREHMQRQSEQQHQQKPSKAPPPPPDQGEFIDDNVDYASMPDFEEVLPIGDQSPPKTERPQFNLVSLADVFTNPPEPQGYIWAGRIPYGVVTLLAAHGGMGKSLFALLLAICVAVGRDFFGMPTASLKTIFFSAEDSSDTLRRRVAAICKAEEIDPAVVADNLTLIDATDASVLFEEVNVKGVRFVAVSENYPTLKKLIDDNQVKFAIIDNASDVYAADPVNRQYVTQFIRALVRLLPSDAIDKAVLLLAHVNRNTAKAGPRQQDTEGYADSAAWHNATRSRLFLNAIDDNGGLELKHLKNNFGVKQPPLFIQFRDDGSGFYVPNTLNDEVKEANKAATDRNNKLAILGLIREFYDRGEWISSEPNSRSNAHAMLKHEQAYPFKKGDRDEREGCSTLLRECHREKLLIVETYKKSGRDTNNRWALTEKVVDLLKWSSIVRDELDA